MTKAVTNKQPTDVADPSDLNAWGPAPSITVKDLVIAKILMCQPGSKAVAEEKAKFGQLIDSVNGTIIGGVDAPFVIIPFHMEKMWVRMRKEGKKWKFWIEVPINEDVNSPGYNDDWEYETEDAEGEIQNLRTWNTFCLLEADLKDGKAIPYTISFKSTSSRAGQKLITQMYVTNVDAGQGPAAVAMEISATKREKDGNNFAVMDIRVARNSTKEEIAAAFKKHQAFRKGGYRVDHSDLESKTKGPEFKETGTEF